MRTRWRGFGIVVHPFLVVITVGVTGCDPYRCGTDARSAIYEGRLGQSTPPAVTLADSASGRVALMLNEWRGSTSQQNVIASVNIRGFVSTVSELHVHEGQPGDAGRVLLKLANGYLVGDSAWKTGIELFAGPASWGDLWGLLNGGRGYLEVHSSSGDSVSAALGQASVSDFAPSCT
jgi:hypothetical protein